MFPDGLGFGLVLQKAWSNNRRQNGFTNIVNLILLLQKGEGHLFQIFVQDYLHFSLT